MISAKSQAPPKSRLNCRLENRSTRLRPGKSQPAGRPVRVFSCDQLLSLAFPDAAEVFDWTIDSHIRNIRRKMHANSDLDPIRSVYGVGYAFED
jgi:hypothetical protein